VDLYTLYISSGSGLRDKLENVKNLHEQNTAVLNEALRMLDEEQHQDSQLRARFISEWNRTPSDKLTKELRCVCVC
jgi:hypothetical protein